MPNLKISKSSDISLSMDVKRFYIPGIILSSTCPHCSKIFEKNMEEHYLSYPEANVPIDVHFYHETEEDAEGNSSSHEWSEKIILSISITKAE